MRVFVSVQKQFILPTYVLMCCLEWGCSGTLSDANPLVPMLFLSSSAGIREIASSDKVIIAVGKIL